MSTQSRTYARHLKWARKIGLTGKAAHIQAQQLARAEERRGRFVSRTRGPGEPIIDIFHKGRVWTAKSDGVRFEAPTRLGAVRGLRKTLRERGYLGSRA